MKQEKWPIGLPRGSNRQLTMLESVSRWFEVYQVNDHVFALLEPNHDEEVISYLVLGRDRAALIDTGMGIGNILDEVNRITNLPVVVLNTHSHFDHIGDNHRFEDVCIFNNDWETANISNVHPPGFCAGFMERGSYCDLPSDFDPGSYQILPARVTRRLNHLEKIELGGCSLTVHHTPGHSPGSICLHLEPGGILFTGDTYYRGPIVLHLPGSDVEAFHRSVKYLSTILDQISFLCTGHNEILADKTVLTALRIACEQIQNNHAPFEIDRQSKFYAFSDFNLRLPL